MNASRLAAVVLDMDGLMLDTEPLYKAAWQTASAECGHALDDVFYQAFVGRPNDDCERLLVERFGPAFPLDRFRARWPELWRAQAATSGIARKPGLIEFLHCVEALRLPVAVATSSDADYTAFSLRQAGLDDRFAIVVTGDQVERGKPAPDIYLEAARRLAVDPARCVALEDSEAGIIAASGAGMIALLVPEVPPSAAAVQAARRVLRSLTEACDVVADLAAGRSQL